MGRGFRFFVLGGIVGAILCLLELAIWPSPKPQAPVPLTATVSVSPAGSNPTLISIAGSGGTPPYAWELGPTDLKGNEVIQQLRESDSAVPPAKHVVVITVLIH